MSEHTYWNAIRELIEDGYIQGRPKHQVRSEIVGLVEAAAVDGEHWAVETLARWATKGADADYTRVFKDMHTVTYIRADGRKLRKTVAYSRPKRSMVSGEIIGRQMEAYWGMCRPGIEELRREMFAKAEQIDDVVAALDQILAAMDQHPGLTAREAWEAEGRSVSEIHLGIDLGEETA